jgi:hypothetical protein
MRAAPPGVLFETSYLFYAIYVEFCMQNIENKWFKYQILNLNNLDERCFRRAAILGERN